MGKRGRGFGRRTVLQLGDFKRGDTYTSSFQQVQKNGSGGGGHSGAGGAGALSGLMASYGESDEEDNQDDQPTKVSGTQQISQMVAPPVAEQNRQPPKPPMDEKLANFLAVS